jgi:hypothetical protein
MESLFPAWPELADRTNAAIMLNAPAADRTPNKVSAKETLQCNTHPDNGGNLNCDW